MVIHTVTTYVMRCCDRTTNGRGCTVYDAIIYYWLSPDEIPLLKVEMVNSEVAFTYPPSMCFFAEGDSLVIPAGVQKFIESKKSTLKARMDEVTTKAIHDLRIGDLILGSDAGITEQKADLQTQLLQETRQRLFGRNVSAWGSVLSVHDEIWFFANQIRFS